MNESNLRGYQHTGVDHMIENSYSGLFLDMGLGKTVITLTAVNRLMYDRFEVGSVLIIGPKRVAQSVWHTEAKEWDHLKHLTFSHILGTERQRKEAMKATADIYVINRENVPWLQAQLSGAMPYDHVVIDESSSFKSAKSQRFKALRMMRPGMKRVTILTGTPRPNSLMDLWSQVYLLDQGERLGKKITEYRARYFNEGQKQGHVVLDYVVKKPAKMDRDILGEDIYSSMVYSKIGDICISMKSEDYLQLPERLDQDVMIDMSADLRKKYLEFERDQVLQIYGEGDVVVSAANAAALTGKLLQFSNGAVYDEQKKWHEIHRMKLEALEEDVEAANGKPFLLFYQYKHDVERIMKHFKDLKPRMLDKPQDIVDWNEGRISLLLAHPASAGHGLNLQKGGNLMGWFGLPWSLELYMQGVKRIHRSGQTQIVVNRRYIMRGTMEEDVILSLNKKHAGQEALMDAVKARIRKHIPNAAVK